MRRRPGRSPSGTATPARYTFGGRVGHLATARAVLFSQLVDDPSSRPELFPTEEDQSQERQRLFRIIEELVKWENTTNETVLEQAREEIRRSWRRTCEDNRDHPRAADLFDPDRLPAFHDPFAGGGTIPLEAQRLGLEAHASDLNPVAVLINKAMIEIPPRFAGRSRQLTRKPGGAVGQRKRSGRARPAWPKMCATTASGCATRPRSASATSTPGVEVTAETAQERTRSEALRGPQADRHRLAVGPHRQESQPSFRQCRRAFGLQSFVLSTKSGKEAYVEPVIENDGYRFTVRVGLPPPESAKNGTKSRG